MPHYLRRRLDGTKEASVGFGPLRGYVSSLLVTCGLRDYGTATWEGGDPECQHVRPGGGVLRGLDKQNDQNEKRKQGTYGAACKCGARRIDKGIGLEPDPDSWVQRLVEVFREVRRVLHPRGTVWCNVGDAYGSGTRATRDYSKTTKHGYWNNPGIDKRNPSPAKQLLMLPARLAMALQSDGWYLRSAITLCKQNPMPESVTDRPTSATEMMFLFAKQARYYYDAESVRQPSTQPDRIRCDQIGGLHGADLHHSPGAMYDTRRSKMPDGWDTGNGAHGTIHRDGREAGKPSEIRAGRNLWNWWPSVAEPLTEQHYAAMPSAWVKPCVLAGTSERGVCPAPGCGAPWQRVVERTAMKIAKTHNHPDYLRTRTSGTMIEPARAETTGWRPGCSHYDDLYQQFPRPRRDRKRRQRDGWNGRWLRVRARPGLATWPSRVAVVLDPFMGSGTTGLVALQLGRSFVGIELSAEYCRMAERRLAGARAQGILALEAR